MATYTTLNAVKKQLLTAYHLHQGGRRIDFSESYVNLAVGANNSGGVSLSRVDYADSHFGIAEYQVAFTDTTSFTAIIIPDPNRTQVSLGSGTRFNTFTAVNPWTSDNMFTISPSYWSGSAVAGDLITWRSNSVISNETAADVINDAEFCIDSGILASQKVTPGDRSQLIYTASSCPRPLQTAAKYLASFMIYQMLNPTANLHESEAFQWFQIAKSLVDDYIKSLASRGPTWMSRAPLVSVSANDDLGNPSFGTEDYRQSMFLSLEDVFSRIRKYEANKNYISYSSPTVVTD